MLPLFIRTLGAQLLLICYLHSALGLQQICRGRKGCDLVCESTSCNQKCAVSPCSMACTKSKVCNQNCYKGNCPRMQCLDSKVCSANCDGGNCTNMTCQASSSCMLTCGGTSCSMSCFAPFCKALCYRGDCDIVFKRNSQGNVLCPGGNCRVKCPELGKCKILMCGGNSCTVTYDLPPTLKTKLAVNTTVPSSGHMVGVPQYCLLATFVVIGILGFMLTLS